MKQRCNYPKNKRYDRYGGRGIKVCERWNSNFLAFLEDMGKKPTNQHTLERIDNNGDYEPSNCRWATNLEQSNNRIDSVIIESNGVALTIRGWSERLGIKYKTLRQRLFVYGWSTEKALTYPTRKYNKKVGVT